MQALERTAQDHGQDLLILHAVEAVNAKQKQVLGAKIKQRFGSDLVGKHFAIWGLAFKPNTDDMRAASSRVLLLELLSSGATVAVYDPVSMDEARRVFALDFADRPKSLEKIRYATDPMDALRDADALVIVTEWKAFRSPDFDQLKSKLKQAIIFDGRNLFEPSAMTEIGVEYHGIGRSVLTRV